MDRSWCRLPLLTTTHIPKSRRGLAWLRYAFLAVLTSTPQLLAATRGPDAAGYQATDTAAYSFIDLENGGGSASVLADTDDGAASLTMPFAFQFYGQTYTAVCASSIGLLTFVANAASCASGTDFANSDLTVAGPPGNPPAILPFWTDLTFQAPGAGALYYQTIGTARWGGQARRIR